MVWIPAEKVRFLRREDGSEVVLGEGGYGKVYKALLYDVEVVAVKEIKVTPGREKTVLMAEREVAILKECLSKFVVRFMGASLSEGRILMVTEFCEGGDLWHALKRDREGALGWYGRGRRIALDIASGLHYLHESKHVVHFDLKSPNVLLDGAGTAKLADVGLAKILAHTAVPGTEATSMGTFMWASPEQLMGRVCDFKADIWSLGVILWEICTTGETPPHARNFRKLKAPEECPPEVAALINQCFCENPADRPTALEVFSAISALPR